MRLVIDGPVGKKDAVRLVADDGSFFPMDKVTELILEVRPLQPVRLFITMMID